LSKEICPTFDQMNLFVVEFIVVLVVVVVVTRKPVELVQFLHRSPSRWLSELVLNWQIPPGR